MTTPVVAKASPSRLWLYVKTASFLGALNGVAASSMEFLADKDAKEIDLKQAALTVAAGAISTPFLPIAASILACAVPYFARQRRTAVDGKNAFIDTSEFGSTWRAKTTVE